MSDAPLRPTTFLAGGGKAADMIRERDWSSHPLGPPERWPDTLRTALSLVLNSPESMILCWGPELHFFFNDTYFPLLGPRLSWAMGARFDQVWADGLEQAMPIIDDAMAGRSRRFVDLPWKLGTDRGEANTWWTFSYSRVLDANGAVAGLFIFTNETTEHVQATAALRASEARNRQILDSAIDFAIVATDLDGRVTRWNEGAHRVLGWSDAEMLGETVERFFTPEDVAAGRVATEMRNALETGHGNDERWHQRKGGERFWAVGEMTVLRDEHEAAVGFVKVLRDRTEHRRAEQLLRELNATLEQRVEERTRDRNSLWELSSDLMLRCGFDGLITAVNPAWTDMLGWRENELVGASLFDLIHPDDMERTRVGARELSEGIGHARFDNRCRHRDSSYRWISWSARSAEGLINAVGRNVTADREQVEALRVAEEALRQSQKMEAVGQLTGGVAHDFNNLLTVIRSSTDLLKRPDLPEERRIRYVGAISDTVDRAARLTGQLLAFARRQALRPEVFDAGESLRQLTDMMNTLTGSRIRIVTEMPDRSCFINADPSQFDTAVINIAINARDAMDGQGQLTVAVRRVDEMPAIRAHAAVTASFVAVSLTDTGVGIPAEALERIFEPFFTTKSVGKGTGLGLSQVYGFAKQSGGEVMVTSRVGEGTTFTLYLPEVAAPAAQAEAGEPEALMDGHGTRVLVVEDNRDVGAFATQTLAELGYVTVWAQNAERALEQLSVDGDRFDIVFSDVVMPGMDGIQLGQEIRRLHPALPVVLTSGYSHVLAQNGTYGFELLHKPYSIEELSRILRKAATWQRRRRAILT